MRLDGTRITLRIHRFELVAFGLGLGGLVIGLIFASVYLTSLRPGAECQAIVEFSPACEAAIRRFDGALWIGSLMKAPLLLVTYTIGLFLGVPIIARELERGTVRLAWALAPSRWRWYLARLVPILLVVAILTFVAGVATDQYLAASRPGSDPSQSFDDYGGRGGLLAARAVFVFAASVFVGSFIGRALPAMIVAALVATIGLYGGVSVHERILQGEAVAIPADPTGQGIGGVKPGDKYIAQKFVLTDGTLVGYDYFYHDGAPNEGGQGDSFDQNGNPRFPMVELVIPRERYRFVEARESAALLAGSLVALLVAGFVVARRRPG